MGCHRTGVSRCGILTSLFGITEMNERIRQLALQAGATKRSVCYGHGDYRTELQLSDDDIKKFAELIAKECADWIDRQDESRCPYGIDLLEHFGVEE